MRVYIVRHGEAGAAASDSARSLTPAGRADVEAVAAFLRGNGINPSAIWHSAKVRARETAEILARVGGLHGEILQQPGLLPEDEVSEILRAIDGQSDDVCIVGHLPHLAYLASSLLAGVNGRPFVMFDTATVVCVERDGGSGWRLKWMVSPAQLGA